MKSLEIRPIEFAPFLEKNVVATYDNFEIWCLIAPFYDMNVVAVNNKSERWQVIECMKKGHEGTRL